MKKRVISFLLVCGMVLSLGGLTVFAEEEPVELSDDLYSFEMKINGELYKFPMPYEEFVALGWEFDGNDSLSLEPNSFTIGTSFKYGELTKPGQKRMTAAVSIINLETSELPYNQCMIGDMIIDELTYGDGQKALVEFPKGITCGVSTVNNIKSAYGEPSDMRGSDALTKLTYEIDTYSKWEFYVHPKSGVLQKFSVQNFEKPETTSEPTTVNKDPTPEVQAYKAPTELGSDPLSFVVEIAGDLYQLPAPVSAFLENGWTVVENRSNITIPGRGFGTVYLMKDNQAGSIYVQNYNDNEVAVENCFVTYFKAGTLGGINVPATIPSGVSIGMDGEEMQELLASDDVPATFYEESKGSFTYWTAYLDLEEISENYVQIMIDNETNTVVAIESRLF